HIAALHSILGQKESAFEWLERAYRERSALLTELNSEFWFENIRSDPRFASLTKRVGLEGKRAGDELQQAAALIAQLGKVEIAEVTSTEKPRLCFVDEIDARPGDSWPFETLLTALEHSRFGAQSSTFILAGSSAASLTEMKERIGKRPKGSDLLSRIPDENEFEIPRLNNGDKVIIALQHLRNAS